MDRRIPIDVESITLHGLSAVRCRTPFVEVVIVPGKGADVASFRCLATDTEMLARHPHAAEIAEAFTQRGAAGYGDCFIGGWPSLLPSRARGANLDVGPDRCGEAATVAWDAREAIVRGAFRLVCSAKLPRSGLYAIRTFGFDATGRRLDVRASVMNAANAPIEFHWTEHPTFGGDLLADAFEILLPKCGVHDVRPDGRDEEGSRALDPRDVRVATGAADVFRTLRRPARTWAAIFNAKRGVGAHLRWEGRHLPSAWYWQAHREGGSRMLAIEPSSSHHTELTDDAAGPPLRLAPGESILVRLGLAVIDAGEADVLRRSLTPRTARDQMTNDESAGASS